MASARVTRHPVEMDRGLVAAEARCLWGLRSQPWRAAYEAPLQCSTPNCGSLTQDRDPVEQADENDQRTNAGDERQRFEQAANQRADEVRAERPGLVRADGEGLDENQSSEEHWGCQKRARRD